MGRGHRVSGLLLVLALGGCGSTFKGGGAGGAGGVGGSSAGTQSSAGSQNEAGDASASAGTSSSGGSSGAPVGGAGEGGAASGGAGAGGASGGSSAGGANGGVSSGGTSSGGATMAGAECAADEDCKLVDDCCSCSAEPKDVRGPACTAVCIQSACSARGLQGKSAKCVAKRCVLELSCNESKVTCKAARPVCGSGQVPSVVEGCWGPCIDPTECHDVQDCKACGAGSTCVTQSLMMPSTHCVRVSAACEAAPSCECVDACSQTCSDEDGKVDCFCPAC